MLYQLNCTHVDYPHETLDYKFQRVEWILVSILGIEEKSPLNIMFHIDQHFQVSCFIFCLIFHVSFQLLFNDEVFLYINFITIKNRKHKDTDTYRYCHALI